MPGFILLLHILSATVWTGGHLVLALTILPGVLKEKSPAQLLRFESSFERIGLPALFIQLASGLWLSYHLLPNPAQWFTLDNPISRLITAKLTLLVLTAVLALDSRLRLIPQLSEKNLISLAWHIVAVTILSVLFVVFAVAFRSGWLM